MSTFQIPRNSSHIKGCFRTRIPLFSSYIFASMVIALHHIRATDNHFLVAHCLRAYIVLWCMCGWHWFIWIACIFFYCYICLTHISGHRSRVFQVHRLCYFRDDVPAAYHLVTKSVVAILLKTIDIPSLSKIDSMLTTPALTGLNGELPTSCRALVNSSSDAQRAVS